MIDQLLTLSQHYLNIKNQSYRRYFIQKTDLSHRMNILIGARGTGKTTTLVQHLLDYVEGDLLSKQILYLQADHFLLGNYSLYDIAEQFVLHGGEYIAFDEIHKYANWSSELKSIYDTFNTLKVFASGSSALEIHKGTHDLSRRALVYYLQGLSFREYLELNHDLSLTSYSLNQILETGQHEALSLTIVNHLESHQIKIISELKKYYQCGYYPFFEELTNPIHFSMALEQNVHVTLESDLSTVYPHLTGHSILKIRQLLSFIASHVPFISNWSKLKNIVDITDARTLKNYFKYLEDANLIKVITQASNKLKKLESSEKVYLNNANLLYTLSAETPNIGTIRETFFLSMLAKDHEVTHPKNGDFNVDNQYIFEIGGRNKDYSQIKKLDNAYLVVDDMVRSTGNKIPLWLFGFLY